MEPIEINAGNWYLRGLRADDHYAWSVCEPTTGDQVATVDLVPSGTDAVVTGQARPGQDAALTAGIDAVRRFAVGALGLTVTVR